MSFEKCWAFTFYSLLLALFAFTIIGTYMGRPREIARPIDPDSFACGGPGLEQYPYAYFVNPNQQYLNKIVCVKECPSMDSDGNVSPLKCAPNSLTKSCIEQVSITNQENAVILYDSFIYKGSVCIPSTIAFYEEIKIASIPNFHFKVINDLYVSKWIILLVGFVSMFISWAMMRLLKRETKSVIWTFTIGVFVSFGLLGIIYAKLCVQDMNYQQSSDKIASFKVSEEYISEMTYIPKPEIKFILSIVFIILTLYGTYKLFTDYQRINQLIDIFEIVEKFMKENPQIQEFIKYQGLIIQYISFTLFLMTLILTGSIFSYKTDTSLLPYDRIELSPLSYAIYIMLVFSLWLYWVNQGFLSFYISLSLNRWVLEDVDSTNYNKNQGWKDLQSLNQRASQIIFCSLKLLPTIIKLIADAGRDWAQQYKMMRTIYKYTICCFCYGYYHIVRDIEEIIYVEMASRQDLRSLADYQRNVKEYLELSDKREIKIEAFERIRNIGQFFILIAKLLVSLLCIFITGSLLGSINYFSANLYDIQIPSLISGIFGYYISSTYFATYQIVVQGLGYIYLKEYHKKEKQYTNINCVILDNIKFKDLQNMMQSFLIVNQDDQA